MNKIKKNLLLMLFLVTFFGMHVNAAQDETATETESTAKESGEVFIAFGADLSESQKAEVVRIFGLSEEELSKAVTVTVTNEEEHQYLGSYLDSSVIGTKSLSSVMVRKAEAGHGVVVTTKNITYCTTGM